MEIDYSIVVPLKNEEENIIELIEELEPIMQKIGGPWELICIDDGSTDGTGTILERLSASKSYLRVITFERNYGQSSAFDAGFRNARGKWIITLDGDRQNDPADIPKMLSKIETSDLVCGHRFSRQDPWHKKVTSRLANFVRSRFCKDNVKDTGCSLKVYRAACLNRIKMFHGMHRFLPALFKIEGFSVTEVPVNHRERTKGVTKYNFFNRSFNTIMDMIVVRWMWSRRLQYRVHERVVSKKK